MKPKENVTASSIKRMSYTDLQKLCSKKDIEFKGQNRETLINLLISKLSSLEGEIPAAETVGQEEQTNGKAQPKVKGEKIDKKVAQPAKADKKKAAPEKKEKTAAKKGETKSSKILALHAKGKKVSEIHKLLDAHPSFIYTVLAKAKLAPNK
jgi:hypothetical protein